MARSRGFSLFELMIVVTIILILSGIATPTLFRTIRSYQLESAGRQVANIILQARYEAMQRNRRVCAVFQRAGAEGRYGLDLVGADAEPCDDPNPQLTGNEPFMVTNNVVNWWFNDNPIYPPLTGLPAGYNTAVTIVPPARFRVVFSPRGTIVQPGAGGTWTMATQTRLICLVRNIPNDFDAVLVTVTPVGRIKLYRWRINSLQWAEL
ncbi:MAG: pilus assembly FimT family protein [Candidatus Acidiferrales bacterium]